MISRKDFYKNLHLIKQIAITDFKLKYQGSVFGYLWSLFKPLAFFSALYLVFNNFFKLGQSIPHYPIFLLIGVVFFTFWGEATTAAMYSIATRGDLIRKIYFPRIVLVISATITSTITLMLNLSIVIALALATGVDFTWGSLMIIPLILEMYLFVVGFSFYLAAFFVKYRDVGHIWEVGNQILFYATPIVYSLAIVPVSFAKIMVLSPLAQIIQGIRSVLIDPNTLTVADYWQFPLSLFPVVFVFFILISGYFVFQKMAAKFAEEV